MAQREHFLIPDQPYQTYGDYLKAVGGSAIEAARAKSPDDVIAELKRAGLRGRGGAGFHAGVKWASLRGNEAPTKCVVVNGAEGEPGTFKDRYLLRRNPYSLIEGLVIGAETIGATRSWIAMKSSFFPELERVRRALDEMKTVLGRLEVNVVEGPEEYLFGEEKALLSVIEGEGPLPRSPDSPPYEVGLFARPGSPNPALVNNVETFSRVATILRSGAESFRKLGTTDTPGPVIFTLSGDLARPGVYELEPGITLRKLFDGPGGGPLPGRSYKAALSGVSSGVIPAARFDTPADFASLAMLGAGFGSAGFIVMDDSASMPRVAQSIARFLYVESCYQCSACKNGLRIASSALDELFDPRKATPDDPERAMIAAQHAPQGNRCFLPVQGSILIPSILRRFPAEFEAQVAAPTQQTRAFHIPKLADYDEAEHRFTLDENQELKRPDWTYDEPAAAPHIPSEPAAQPLPVPEVPAAPVFSAAAPPPPAPGPTPARRAVSRLPTDLRTTAPMRPPSKRPVRELTVRLQDDVLRELKALVAAERLDLDREVEAVLRKWIEDRRRPK